MFNMSMNAESRKLAGPGYIILNILRVFNIISLLTVAVGSWIMLVRTVQTSNVSRHRCGGNRRTSHNTL